MKVKYGKWKRLGQGAATAGLVVLGPGLGRAQTLDSPQPETVDLVDEIRRAWPRLAAHDSLDLQHGRKSVLLVPVVDYVSSGHIYTGCPILKKSCQFLREKKRVGSSPDSRLSS